MLDTSTAILLGRIDDPADLPEESVVSAVTLAELSVGPPEARTRKERAARQAHLQQTEGGEDDGADGRASGTDCSGVMPLSRFGSMPGQNEQAVVDATGESEHRLQRPGRIFRLT